MNYERVYQTSQRSIQKFFHARLKNVCLLLGSLQRTICSVVSCVNRSMTWHCNMTTYFVRITKWLSLPLPITVFPFCIIITTHLWLIITNCFQAESVPRGCVTTQAPSTQAINICSTYKWISVSSEALIKIPMIANWRKLWAALYSIFPRKGVPFSECGQKKLLSHQLVWPSWSIQMLHVSVWFQGKRSAGCWFYWCFIDVSLLL